jgi:hypothetical protein
VAKDRKTEVVSIRLTPGDYAIIEKEAQRYNISTSQVARNIILDHFSKKGPSNEPMTEKEKQEIVDRVMESILSSDEFRAKQKELMKELLKEMAK